MKFVAHYDVTFANREDSRKVYVTFETVLNDVMIPEEGTVMPVPTLNGPALMWCYRADKKGKIESKVRQVGRYLGEAHWQTAPGNAQVLHSIVYVDVVCGDFINEHDMTLWGLNFEKSLRAQKHIGEIDYSVSSEA